MAADDVEHQIGKTLAGIADHLDRVAFAREFDSRRLDFAIGLGIGHGHFGLVARHADAPGRGVTRRSMGQLNKP
ncbi:hypothetical protein D3C72_2418980 [compost metagenome]